MYILWFYLSHQVDEKPVTDVGFSNDHFNALAFDSAISHSKHEGANVRTEDNGNAVYLKTSKRNF